MFRTSKKMAHQVILIAVILSTGIVIVGMLKGIPCPAEVYRDQVEIANNVQECMKKNINDGF